MERSRQSLPPAVPLFPATNNENSRPLTSSAASWLSPFDTTQTSGIADTKLKRQSERISQDEAALGEVLRPKPNTRGRVKTWKPFDFTDSSDDNLMSADDQPKPIGFDVHAKVFQPGSPRAPASRDTPLLSPSRLGGSGGSVDDDFQLITGRKSKPTGLNPYETKPDVRPATVAATYSKREVYEVFGNDLPGPEYCAANMGFKNGQVQFCMHPNGDISAQQWNAPQTQWLNLGQFSNIRKKTEGQLASERLKGETELQSLQQNTLAYFRAVAKQREAAVMGLPFGVKEIQACLPNLRLERTSIDSTKSDVPSYYTLKGTVPTRGGAQFPNPTYINPDRHSNTKSYPASDLHHPVVPALPQSKTWSALLSANPKAGGAEKQLGQPPQEPLRNPLADLTFGDLPALSRQLSDTPYGGPLMPAIPSQPKAMYKAALGRVNTGSAHAASADDKDDLWSVSKHGEEYQEWVLRKINAQYAGSHVLSAAEVSQPANSYAAFVDEKLASRRGNSVTSTEPSFEPTQHSRVPMKDFLNRIGDSASARGSANSAGRTVLYDPLQARSANVPAQTPVRASAGSVHTQLYDTPSKLAYGTTPGRTARPSVPSVPPGFPPRAELSRELSVSEPDDDCKRLVNTYDIQTSWMSNEQLAATAPTPQNWNGPFFTGVSEYAPMPDTRTYDEKLHDWFHSGNKVERQEEFYRSICATSRMANRQTPIKSSHPGVIARPTKDSLRNDIPPFNETSTRLLIPMLENLSSYVQGPSTQRYDPFNRFTQPQEWHIDKSEHGNRSFFGEDWAKTPQRVGRDPRYRPVSHDGRVASFESSGLGNGLSPVAVRYSG